MTEKRRRGRPREPMTQTRQQAIVFAMYQLTTEYIGRPIGWGKPERQKFRTDAAFNDALSRWENLRDKVLTRGTKSTYLPANTAALILENLSTVPAADRLSGGVLRKDLRDYIYPLISRYPKQSQERIVATIVEVSSFVPMDLSISAVKKMYREYHRERGLAG